jgi:hypothetical protein
MTEQPFNWREHITIDPAFSRWEREAIENSIDSLANLPDGEGRQLLQGAIDRAGGTLPIKFSYNRTGIANEPEHFVFNEAGILQQRSKLRLYLNMREAADLYYSQPDGTHAHPSLTGVIVHELFHANDYSTDISTETQSVHSAIAEVFGQLPEEQVAAIGHELENIHPRLLQEIMSDNGDSIQKTAGVLRDNGRVNLADYLEQQGPEKFRTAFEKVGLFDKNGEITAESMAVRYTDQFMRKHFGRIEPQRGIYKNADTHASHTALPKVPKPLEHMDAVSGFHEDYTLPVSAEAKPLPTVEYSIGTECSVYRGPSFNDLLKGVKLNLHDIKHDPHDIKYDPRVETTDVEPQATILKWKSEIKQQDR